MIEDIGRDVRFAFRTLTRRKNWNFTAVAAITLGLAIAATTTIFSVAWGILYDAYPYARSSEMLSPWVSGLVATNPANPQSTTRAAFPVNFSTELAKLPAVGELMYTNNAAGLYIEGPDGREIFPNTVISGGGFAFLGVPPLMGRTIQPSDISENGEAAPVAVLSYKTWKRLYPDDSNPVGKVYEFRNAAGAILPKTIVGIMPERFGGQPSYGIGDSMWSPMSSTPPTNPNSALPNARPRIRLKPGVSRSVAEQQIHALYLELAKDRRSGFWINQNGVQVQQTFTTTLRTFADATFDSRGIVRTNFRYLFFAVGFLLLIGCVNVANLQLARATARSREIAIRLAVGASRIRLVRQLLTESILLSLAGSVLGVGLALAGVKISVALLPTNIIPQESVIAVNGTVLVFSFGIALLSGILFGLAPAIQTTRPDLNDTLKDSGQGVSDGRRGARTRGTLVVVEVALSIVLLVGANLAARAYVKLAAQDPGFQPERLYLGNVPLMGPRYSGFRERIAFAPDLVERLKKIPAVEDAAVGVGPGYGLSQYTIQGQPKDDAKRIEMRVADENYARVFGLTIRRGRNFTQEEVAAREHVAMISETAAKLWANGEDPIGKQITIDFLIPRGPTAADPTLDAAGGQPALTVIGIVSDIRANLANELVPSIVLPHTLYAGGGTFVLRTRAVEAGDLRTQVRKVILNVDPALSSFALVDTDTAFENQFRLPRFNLALFSAMAGVALVLAVAGIYSVLSYHVAQQTRDIGVRIALGASAGQILRAVLLSGGRLVVIGLFVGVAVTFALARIVASQDRIFTVPLSDPTALAGVAAALAILGLGTLFACYLPARRATKVDPLIALRYE